MISAINSINTFFTGNKYRKPVQILESCIFPGEPVKIIKKLFNYSAESGSVPVKPYLGSLERSAGISTEEGGYGGGYLIGAVDRPLSTTDIHTCALLNLFNINTFKQALYHVYDKTSVEKIVEFIRKIFPDFTGVNIAGGDQLPTKNTMRKIAEAVDSVNPNVPKTYFHTVCENPQLVTCNGEISYIKGMSGKLSFVQDTEHYWD